MRFMSRPLTLTSALLLAVVLMASGFGEAGAARPDSTRYSSATAVTSPARAPIQYARNSGPSQNLPSWSFWLSAVANALIIAQLLVVFFGAYQLLAGREERRKVEAEAAALARKAANYQAWQVVNSAQGKGGSGGRIDALQDLNRNGISLAAVRLDGAWLEGIQLPGANLVRASLREAQLSGANLQGANLQTADLTDAILVGADLRGAHLKDAILKGAQLGTVDLRGADLTDLREWQAIRSVSYLNAEDIRNPPEGFREWALERGAVDGSDESPEDEGSTYSKHFRVI